MTTVGALVDLLLALVLGQPLSTPVCVSIGRGFKCAPVTAELRCMTPDQRSGWWDIHQDPGCTLVVRLYETTRAEEK